MTARIESRASVELHHGVEVTTRGSLIAVTLPCGASAMITRGQALELGAALTTAHNALVRRGAEAS